MMLRRITIGAAVCLYAAGVQAFNLQAIQFAPPTVEGDGQVFVAVRLEREPGDVGDCSLDFTFSVFDGGFPGATGGVDYQPATFSGNLTLLANDGTVEASFPVTVLDDAVLEPDEVFQTIIDSFAIVDCSGGPVATPPDPNNVLIIDDDAAAIAVGVVPTVLAVDEGAGSAAVRVDLTGAGSVQPPWSVTVDFATAENTATDGLDFTGVSGTLSFDDTQLSRTITVPVLEDALAEPNEDFTVDLSNASGNQTFGSPFPVAISAPTATVTITDNDSPAVLEFTAPAFSAAEGAGTLALTVTRSGNTNGAVTVDFATADGTAAAASDYGATSGTLSWADGEGGDRTILVTLNDDALDEQDETFTVTLSNATGFATLGNNGTATATITDDDAPGEVNFVGTDVNVAEDAGSVSLTVRRGGAGAGVVTVDYATADGTATAGEDYTGAAGTVTWADGDTADKTIVIDLLDDATRESDETFTVAFGNVTGPAALGANATITVTIAASDESRDIAGLVVLNPNQRALAVWFDDVCPRLGNLGTRTADQEDLNSVCQSVKDPALADGAVRTALDAINPDELLFASFNALRLTAVQHGNLAQRINALRGGATGIDLAGLTLEIDGQQIAGNALESAVGGLLGGGASADEGAATWGRWGGFVDGRYSSGDKDRSANEAGFDFDLWGVTAGVDYRIRQNFIVGAAVGYGEVDSNYESGGGGLDIESLTASVFLTYFREGTFYLDALATWGSNDYDSTRRILFSTGSGTVDRTARGGTDGDQYSVGFGTGFDFSRGAWTFGPHLGGYYFSVDVDSFNETGSGGLALAIGDQETQSLTLNAGAHVSYAITTRWGVLVPNARVDWVHEFEDNRETLRFQFLNDPFVGDPSDPSPTITLQTDRPDPDYFILSAGVSAQFIYGLSGFVNYQAYTGYRDVTLDEVAVGLRWEKTF